MKVKQIAAVCSLKEYQVAAFRSVERLPPFMAARLDLSDMRAIYDLFRAWERDGPAIEAAMPAEDVFLTITEARRIIEAATGKTTNSVFLTRGKDAAPQPVAAEEVPQAPSESVAAEPEAPSADETKDPKLPDQVTSSAELPSKGAVRPTDPPRPAPAAPIAPVAMRPVFIMETADGRRGVLVTERRAQQAGNVLLDVAGGEIAEVMFSELRPVEVA
jgi:ParB family chromosome partitioning protein